MKHRFKIPKAKQCQKLLHVRAVYEKILPSTKKIAKEKI